MSFSRRRIIALLTLTTILLVTMDLRGSTAVDGARRTFADVMAPLQRAGRLVANPVEDAWRGIRDYDELKEENVRLREQVAEQEGDTLAAIVAVREYQELQQAVGLDVDYSNVAAQVLQYSAQNFQQTVEINVGEQQGVRVGMSVMSPAGLVGKITRVYSNRSIVMLITDPQFAVSVKVVGEEIIPGSSLDPTLTTTTTTAPTTTTTAAPSAPATEVPPVDTSTPEGAPPDTSVPGGETTTTPPPDAAPSSSTTTTVPLPELSHRELGGLLGQGPGQPPIVSLIASDRRGLEVSVGDVVATSGGCQSLAPADLVIGRVSNVVERPGSAGPIVEVEPAADLDNLNFLLVVLYLPPAEVPGTCE